MTLAAGSRLGAYEILAPLGAGGMGEVYRARDVRLSREVAIKVLPSATASDPDRRARFEGEARSASALNHPNILTIYDIGEADGTVYIAMELIEGKTLRELIASEPLPTKKLLEVAVQTAEGLAKAHGAGIVHRDLKPENIMVSKDGFVKILDFGLAKLTEPVSQAASVMPTAIAAPTQPGTVMGTAGYMSPEQASGHSVDFRSDQFTLGSILYEMATGQKAFQRNTGAETLVAIIREEPAPLAQLAPKAPAPVRWIVERCLAKDPEERYASTKDLARDLKSLRDHLTETSVSGMLEAAEPARARRRGWLFPALLAFLLGGAAALLAVRRLELFAPTQLAFQKITFRRGAIGTARFAQDGKTVVYGAAWDGAPMEIFSTNPESPESKSLGLPAGDVLAVSKTGELAIALGWRLGVGWETTGTLARVPLSGGAPREVVESVQDADWSPDGKELGVITNPANGRARLEFPVGTVLAESSGWLSDIRISPDQRTVAFFDHPERGENSGRLVFVDVATRKRTNAVEATGAARFVWTGTDEGLVSRGQTASLQFVTKSGRMVGRTLTLGVGFAPGDFASNGILLARRRYSRREMVGLAPGETIERNLTWLDWSYPDNTSDDGKTVLFDEQSRPRPEYLCYVRKTDGSPAVLLGKAKGLDLSPDGRWALTTNPTADQLTLVPTGPGSSRTLAKTNLLYQWAQFFPDGKRVVIWGNEPGRASRLYVQSLEDSRPRPITPEGFGLSLGGGKGISPDGRMVLLRGADSRNYVCQTDGGAAPTPIPGTKPEEVAWGWTADGRGIYVGRIAMPARIEICDVATGERRPWKELVPPDPAGVLAIGPIYIAPDGKSYVYSYRRLLDELFLVTGLK